MCSSGWPTALISLESAADGIYLCYIAEHGSAAGYFGFYLKSNGNLLSVNERVNEAFAGEHKRSRNARWTDEKKYRLFPYSFIMQFSEHDYKGYATKHIIDEDKLSFMELGSDAYMPLILAMVMLNQKYVGRGLDDLPLIYVDSLMPVNLKHIESGSQALMIPSDAPSLFLTGSSSWISHRRKCWMARWQTDTTSIVLARQGNLPDIPGISATETR